MKPLKHKKQIIVWGVTSAVLAGIMIAVGVLSNGNRVLDNLLTTVFGGERAITDSGATNVKVYTKECDSKSAARKNGNDVTKEINEEGIILLKNDAKALPLAKGGKISVFGKNSANPVHSGTGSVSGNTDNSDFIDIYSSLTDAGFEINPKLKAFYEDDSLSGEGRKVTISMDGGNENSVWATGETAYSSYTADVKNSYDSYKDAAVIVLARVGGEGGDLPFQAADDSSRHYLELDANEAELLKQVCAAGFKHVVLVVNSNNPLELGFLEDTSDPNYHKEIDGALWCGGFGSTGAEALGEILCGAVNPSGHTVDTFAKDFTAAPSYQNFGTCNIANGDKYFLDGKGKQYYFVHYEEGIYVGYRYYETRGTTDGETWYNNNVVYPFGYGLSYTTFDWKLENEGSLDKIMEDKFTVKVNVKNTGDVAGKEVVQIYVGAPYTTGGIEKSSKVLAGYAKTSLLEPGKDETVEVEIDPYLLASYDYSDKNDNGFKGYELEAGDYQIYVSDNAHDAKITHQMHVDTGIQYSKDPTTGKEVVNRFDDCDDQLSTVLSRADWTGTFPTSPSDTDRNVSSDFINTLKSTAVNNPNATGHTAPTTGAKLDNPLSLYDMVGASWDDSRWESLLDECTADELLNLFTSACYCTQKMESIEKPATTSADGPQGFTLFMGDPSVYNTNVYPSEPVVAATFSHELAKKEGKAMGEEGLWGDEEKKGSGLTYSSIYAPGVNIHRSPFGGRLGEYYSEDPYLNGMMSSDLTQGAASKGVITYTKHFVGNEQETHRSSNGDCTWLNEQSLRELYLRPFELNIKVGETYGMMTSFNRLGTTWTGGDYRLLTQVVREEWGFHGAIICDFSSGKYMNTKQMLYAGGNLNLATVLYDTDVDAANADDLYFLRYSAKEVLYSFTNSNVVSVKILGYKIAVWKEVEYIIFGCIAAGLIGWAIPLAISEVKYQKKQD